MHTQNYVAKHAHAQSQFGGGGGGVGGGGVKQTCDTRVIHYNYYTRAALAWTKKKRSLRNEKLKANRASAIEEQRKEMLRIRRESKKTENHE